MPENYSRESNSQQKAQNKQCQNRQMQNNKNDKRTNSQHRTNRARIATENLAMTKAQVHGIFNRRAPAFFMRDRHKLFYAE